MNILITGSTDGIGKLTAIRFAKDGHSVYIHGRNQEKINTTIAEIKKQTGNNKIKGFIGDLSDLKSVKQMIQNIHNQISKLDVLINNAGVFKSSTPVNKDGLDLRFVVNYLSPYLLTNGLMPLLKNSHDARILNLSSAAQSPLNYSGFLAQTDISDNEAYASSKLALTMWSFYLSKIHDNINVIAVNPGSLLNTKMVQEAYGQFWSSADKGADILFELVVLAEHQTKSGQYFDNDSGTYTKAHRDAYNETAIKELITFTNKILE